MIICKRRVRGRGLVEIIWMHKRKSKILLGDGAAWQFWLISLRQRRREKRVCRSGEERRGGGGRGGERRGR
jgi:hypothetical protein